MTPEAEALAAELAEEIHARQVSLERDEAAIRDRGPHTGYARSATDRKAEKERVNGLFIALAIVLGRKNDLQLARQYVAGEPTWRALL